MADFRPETTVYLFESTGVDEENQPYFTSEGAKLAWYRGKQAFAFDQYSYQRENRQYIRVNAKAGDLRKCDMLAFKNSDWKWIFCNILSIEFINPNTTEITFKTDSFATFVEDIVWCDCFIEREMQSNDWNGGIPSFNNLQPEGLETGMMKRTPESIPKIENAECSMVIQSLYDETGEPVSGGGQLRAGYPESLNMIVMDINDSNRLMRMIAQYDLKGRTSGIQAIYLVPTWYAQSNAHYYETKVVNIPYSSIDGYKPNNAKCFTNEFFYMELSNRRGSTTRFAIENLDGPRFATLAVKGGFAGGSGGMVLYIENYPNGIDNGVVQYNDIQVPFVTDTFTQWVSANKFSLVADMVGSIAMGAVGSAIQMPAVTASAASKAGSSIARLFDNMANPLGAGGQSAGSGLPICTQTYGFKVNWVHPYAANIQSIDEYFSRFGYRTNRVKKPNVDTRPLWNYVKTAGSVVRGPFDHSDKLAIQKCLDNGVTLWHVPAAEIGDYSNMAGNKE